MQKANEISQKKIKEYASEISNMQGTIKALTSQVSDQAAKEAANEEALEQLRLQ